MGTQSVSFGFNSNPFAPKVDQNEQFRRAMAPSVHNLLTQKSALEQAFTRVVLQADHSPGSIFQLRLQQNQFELEARLVRRTLEQQASVTRDPTFVMMARDYSATIEKLYQDVGVAALTLLQIREANLQNPQIKSNDQLYKTSNDEALVVLGGLQKMRMEALVVPVQADANASIRNLANQANAVWLAFHEIVLNKNHTPSEVLKLQLLQNQLELEAKMVRLTIQSSAQPTEATNMAVRDYLNITAQLYGYTAQSAILLLSNPEANHPLAKGSYKISSDIATLVIARLHAMRMETL